jgi:hypothetical protein
VPLCFPCQQILDLEHYLDVLYRKPGALTAFVPGHASARMPQLNGAGVNLGLHLHARRQRPE